MPPLPVVPGAIKVEFLWTQAGVPAANVLHIGYTGGPPVTSDLVSLGEQLNTDFWPSDMSALFSTATTFVGFRCTDLSSSTGAVGEFADGSTGTDELGDNPAQACMLVNFGITRRYRGGHPRMYLPALGRNALATPSTWSTAAVSAATTVISAMLADMVSHTFGSIVTTGFVCVSYIDAGAPRVDPLVEPITAGVVSGLMATQRRRVRASSY